MSKAKEAPIATTGHGPIPDIKDDKDFAAASHKLAELRIKARSLTAEIDKARHTNITAQDKLDAEAKAILAVPDLADARLDVDRVNEAADNLRGLENLLRAVERAIVLQTEEVERLRLEFRVLHRPRLIAMLRDMGPPIAKAWATALQLSHEAMGLREKLQDLGHQWPINSTLIIPGVQGAFEPGGGVFGSFCEALADDRHLTGKEDFLQLPAIKNVALYVKNRVAVNIASEQERKEEEKKKKK